MLNPQLYNALLRTFGKVEVANEGVHATIAVDPSGLGSWSIAKDGEGSEEYRVNCPFCKDHKGHLYISHMSYAAPIVNGMQLQVGRLLAHCFRRECIKDPNNRDILEGRIGMAMSGEGTTPVVDMSEPDETDIQLNLSNELTLEGLRTWIPDWQLIDENTDPAIIKYLEERRITQDDIDWLHIGWGPIKSVRIGGYLNHKHPWVLFPVLRNGKLAGVQARCPTQFLDAEGIKYYFHPACRKKTIVFNLDIARQIGIGVLCEGVFDVASIGKPGVCIFGHTPSVTQKRLLAANLQGLVWLPDTDVSPTLNAIEIATKQAAEWNAAGVFSKGCCVVTLPQKDAGSMARQQVWETILQQVPPAMQETLLKEVVPKL